MPVSPTSPTSDGVPRSNSFSNRMSKILHAAQSMSPTIGRKKVSKKDSNDNIGKWHSQHCFNLHVQYIYICYVKQYRITAG